MSLQAIDAVAAVGGLARLVAPEATGLGEFRSSLPQSRKIIDPTKTPEQQRSAQLRGEVKVETGLTLFSVSPHHGLSLVMGG